MKRNQRCTQLSKREKSRRGKKKKMKQKSTTEQRKHHVYLIRTFCAKQHWCDDRVACLKTNLSKL